MAIISTRVDSAVKEQLKQVSHELGIPISTLFNARAKELIRTRKVSFSLDREEDLEMYANQSALQERLTKSINSGPGDLVI